MLILLSPIYAFGLYLRGLVYALGIRRVYRPPVRTVCVGNITAGGTGKSPLVELVAAEIHALGRKAAVVRRSSVGGLFPMDLSDEAEVFAENVPDVTQVSERDKLSAVKRACGSNPDIVLVDDGFQTISFARDLDVVTVDATAPFGNGFLLPGGTLREPKSALSRAGAVVLTRCEIVGDEDREKLKEEIGKLTDAAVFEASFEVSEIMNLQGDRQLDPSFLERTKVFAFCGIGNPEGFFATLKGMGCDVAGVKRFRDHHTYSSEDVSALEDGAEACGAEVLVTTQKDAVRLRRIGGLHEEAYFLKVRLDVTDRERLLDMIMSAS